MKLGEVGGKVTNQVKSRPEPGARQRKVNSTLNLDPQNKLFEKKILLIHLIYIRVVNKVPHNATI